MVVDQQHADHRVASASGDAGLPREAPAIGTETRTRNPPRSRGPISIRPPEAVAALPHAELPEPRPRLRHRPAGVDDLELDGGRVVAQPYVRARARSRVAAGVRERLLGDAVQVHLGDARHGRLGSPTTVNAVGSPRRVRCGDQCRQPLESDGRPRRLSRVTVHGATRCAEGVEKLMQLVDGLAGGALDAAEQVARGIRSVVDDRAGGPGLHAHHRDVVGDDVVQLAGDAHAVEGDGLRRGDLALALELGGALLERRALRAREPRAVAEVVRPAEVEQRSSAR